MKVLGSLDEVRSWRAARAGTQRIGFVPTMGALHDGHVSLIRRARAECDLVVVSVFVNPTQFGPGEDFDRYPRDREGDLRACRETGVDLVWLGDREQLYPVGFATRVEGPALARHLCGRSRPHHFGGVALIVLKLFNVVRPQRAYFGLKDYQQYRIVERMVRDLNLEVEVVPCPIRRDPSGLAQSSRNQLLTAEGRAVATRLHRGLEAGRTLHRRGERRADAILAAAREVLLQGAGEVELDYLELVDPDTLEPLATAAERALLAVAARVEGVRLIDNVLLKPPAEGRR